MPVWNEGERVVPTIRAFAAAVRTPYELLVVHDMPEDTTVPVVERLAAEIPGLRAHHNTLGPGVLNAMKAGMAAARAPYVLVTMADGSDEYGDVDRMVALARDGADVVAASRYMRGGRQVGGPRLKRLLSRVAGLSLHWVAGVPIHDADEQLQALQPPLPRRHADRERGRLRAGDRAVGQGDPPGPPPRRGPHHLARPNRRREPLPAPEVAAPLPPLVQPGLHWTLAWAAWRRADRANVVTDTPAHHGGSR